MKRIKTELKAIISLALIALMLLFGGISGLAALASDITNAEYLSTITITNNGTAVTNGVAVFTLSTSDMVTGGILSATADDCAMLTGTGGTDLAFMPSANSTYPWCTWVNSIGANSSLYEYLYSKGATGGKIRTFLADAGMATADSVSLELADNFTISQPFYLDSTIGNDKYLVHKKDAFYTYADNTTAGTIIASISENWTTPTSHSDIGGSWIDEAQGYDNNTGNDTTWDASVGNTAYTGYISFSIASATRVDKIRIWTNGTGNGKVDLAIHAGSWVSIGETAVTDGAWNTISLNDTYTTDVIRIRIKNTSGGPLGSMSINEVDIGAFYSVSAAGIASGERIVRVVGAQNYPVGATGSVLNFDGTANGYVNFGAVYNSQAVFGLSFWFKPVANFTAGSGTQVLWEKWDGVNDNYYFIRLSTATGKLTFDADCLDPGGISLVSAESSWVGGTWYHVYVELNSTGVPRATLRINGGVPVTDNINTTHMPTSSNLVMGNQTTPGAFGFKGQIMNAVAVTSALSDAQQLALYAGTAPAGAVEYWYADEGTGNSVYSYGTTATTGTKGAGTTWGTATHTAGNTGRLCDFYIQIDGVTYGGMNLKTLDVPNNANDWQFFLNGVALYVGGTDGYCQKIWTEAAGGLAQHILNWQYLTTFVDQSGNGNSAVPTFRTTSSDADLTATVSAQSGTYTASTPSSGASTGWTMITAVPATPNALFDDGGTGFPGGPQLSTAAEENGQNPTTWLYMFAFGLAMLVFAGIFGATHNARMGQRGSLFLACIGAELVLVYFYIVGTIMGMALIPAGLLMIMLMVWRKSPNPVD